MKKLAFSIFLFVCLSKQNKLKTKTMNTTETTLTFIVNNITIITVITVIGSALIYEMISQVKKVLTSKN